MRNIARLHSFHSFVHASTWESPRMSRVLSVSTLEGTVKCNGTLAGAAASWFICFPKCLYFPPDISPDLSWGYTECRMLFSPMLLPSCFLCHSFHYLCILYCLGIWACWHVGDICPLIKNLYLKLVPKMLVELAYFTIIFGTNLMHWWTNGLNGPK